MGTEEKNPVKGTEFSQNKSGKKAGKRDHAARRVKAREKSKERMKKTSEEAAGFAALNEVFSAESEGRAPEGAGPETVGPEGAGSETEVSPVLPIGVKETEHSAAGKTGDGDHMAAPENTSVPEDTAAPEDTAVPDNTAAAKKAAAGSSLTSPEETPEAEDSASDSVPEVDETDPVISRRPKKKKWVRALVITGIVLTALIVTGLLAAFGVFNYFYGKSNYIAEGETYIPTAASTESTEAEEIREGVNYSIVGTTESTTETTTEPGETEPSIDRTGVYNVLLVGIDIGSGNGNSDSMILCSINYDLHKIFLTTLMRDTEVEIPEYGPRKLNSACAIGGPTLLVDTLEGYFGFEIDNFAMIDFEGMKAVINALGGVDLQITVQEAAFMLIEMDQDQVLHLDGRLALRHARDRSSGGSDFGRTQRQRNVLMAIVKKARRGDIGDIVEAAKAILPYITHDMSRLDLAEILRELPVLIKWEFVQQRIPYDGLFTYANENLVLDVPATMERWHAVVYDGETFEDTILETTEEASGEETEPSGEAIEDGEKESGTSEEDESGGEEPDLIPDDLLKLPDGVYKVSYHSEQYLNPVPEDFNYNNLITITAWKDVKTMEELEELLAFEATGEGVTGRQLAIYGSDYYIGFGRTGRFWKLEKWDGALSEAESAEE